LLDGLIREEKPTASSLSLEIWRKAEAIHFLVVVHQRIHQRDYKYAAILSLCGMKSRIYR
jgi:hypothetical protein